MVTPALGIRPYLRSLAGWTWNRQNEARKFGLTLQEETLTEMLLLKISRDCTRFGLKVRMFTRAQEKANGADWEWTFKGPVCSIALRVQAKRLYMSGPNTGRYGGWKYLGTQARALINDAGIDYFPVFIFYNNQASSVFRRKPSHGFHGPSQWGCAFANAQDVERSISNWPEDIVDRMRPWHELFDLCDIARASAKLSGMKPNGIGADRSYLAPKKPQWLELYKEPEQIENYLEEKNLAGVAYFDATETKIDWSLD